MRYAATILVLVAVLAPGAFAAGQALDPRVKPLQTRVAKAERRIDVLAAQIATVERNLTQHGVALNRVDDKDTCSHALVMDVLALIVEAVTGQEQGRFDDRGACSRVGVARP